MSSTGACFDIGASTRDAIKEFERRQRQNAQILEAQSGTTISKNSLDEIIEKKLSEIQLDVQCGATDAAGNGPLMRLAPIPLFYFLSKSDAIQNAGSSARFTHGNPKAIDACRFYSALIWNAIHGVSKKDLLDSKFFDQHFQTPLHDEVMTIVQGSYKTKNGYEDGIRGKGFIISSLEAALWAFYNDEDSFETGVLLAVNLGDDTDTTAAIYGQLAGAVYGIEGIPQRWRDQLFQTDFLITLANGLYIKGKKFNRIKRKTDVMEDVDQETRPYKLRNSSFHHRKPEIDVEYD
jgi:ADP-ribosylglycohydrolase